MFLILKLKKLITKIYLISGITILAFSLVLTSCTYQPSNSILPNNESSQVISQEETKEIESGPLRLWMQPLDSYNPLVSHSEQFHNISKLIYQSLFEIDNTGRAIPLLAEDFIVSDNKRNYNIVLKDNIYFHDDSKLTADDIIASFNFIKDGENQSPYYYKISYINSVSKVNDFEVKFSLKRPNPYFIFDLIFPVLPSQYLSDEDTNYLPYGTGAYQVKDFNNSNLLKLNLFENTNNSKTYLVENIDVFVLRDSKEAMEKFSEDKLDLVILNDDLYMKYFLRNDLKMLKYPSNNFMFFDINTEKSKILEDPEFFRYFKSILKELTEEKEIKDYIMPGIFTFPINLEFIPEYKSSFNLVNKYNLTKKEEFDLVYKSNDLVASIIAESLEMKIDEIDSNINIKLIALDDEKYNETIDEGDYDIAIQNAFLDNNPDSSWLYLDDPYNKVIGSDSLQLVVNENLVELINSYNKYYNESYNVINNKELYETLDKLILESNYQGIGFKFNAVIQNKRVNGQIVSNSFNKYGIEDIWVWSGQ